MFLRTIVTDRTTSKPLAGCLVRLVLAEAPGSISASAERSTIPANQTLPFESEVLGKKEESTAKDKARRKTQFEKRSVLIASARTDRVGYAKLSLSDLGPLTKKFLEWALAKYVQNGSMDLWLEAAGDADSAIGLFKLTGLGPLLQALAKDAGGGEARSFFEEAINTSSLAEAVLAQHKVFYLFSTAEFCTALPGHVSQPDIDDYEISPQSFLAPGGTKSGEGGCERLLPATLPLRDFAFHRVVVRDENTVDPKAVSTKAAEIDTEPAFGSDLRWGEVLEYRQTWSSLGHSLGEIKYSLPLAPGEAAKVAVIDWKRDDSQERYGTASQRDRLFHDQAVDRDIEDTVRASVREDQVGESFMAGLALGADAALPQYGASAAGRASLGGGFSHTQGMRDVSAKGQQDVHQRTVQNSSLARSRNSSVVVQATQAESNYLSTRIIANLNRGHAVTVQYYEVLRHLAVRTSYVGRSTAILVPVKPFKFTEELARRFRAQIETSLLDSTLAKCFEALVRLSAGDAVYSPSTPLAPPAAETGAPSSPPPKPTPGEPTKNSSPTVTQLKAIVWTGLEGDRDTNGETSVSLEMSATKSAVKILHKPPGMHFYNSSHSQLVHTLDGPYSKVTASVNTTDVTLEDLKAVVLHFRPHKDDYHSCWDVYRVVVEATYIDADAETKVAQLLDWQQIPDITTRKFAKRDITFPSGHELFPGHFSEADADQSVVDALRPLLSQAAGSGAADVRKSYFEQGARLRYTNLSIPELAKPASGKADTPNTTSGTVSDKPASDSATASGKAGSGAGSVAKIPSKQEDQACAAMLVEHLNNNQFYYNATAWLNMDPRERRLRLAGSAGPYLNGLSEVPLAVTGNHLVFRYGGEPPKWLADIKPEAPATPSVSVVTLPTRGVFAEAMLGHCSALEKRDITRLWNFDELPVSLLPNIEALKPTRLGEMQAIVNEVLDQAGVAIKDATDLPTPGEAIAKALELLGKDNIFRDMSAKEEVAGIMAKLIEAAVPPKIESAPAASSQQSPQEAPTRAGSSGGVPSNSNTPPSVENGSQGVYDRYTALQGADLVDETMKLDPDLSGQFVLSSTSTPQKPTPRPRTNQAKTVQDDEYYIVFKVFDYFKKPQEADIILSLLDESAGNREITTSVRKNGSQSRADQQGIAIVRQLSKGTASIIVKIPGISDTESVWLDFYQADIPYDFTSKSKYHLVTVMPKTIEKEITISQGETLGEKIESTIRGDFGLSSSGELGLGGSIEKIVELNAKKSGGWNAGIGGQRTWMDEANRERTSNEKFTVTIPINEITVSIK